jgi:hypothetical protein
VGTASAAPRRRIRSATTNPEAKVDGILDWTALGLPLEAKTA